MNKLEWALWLARHGYRVFPLIPEGKKPAIDSFPIAATTDADQIHAWWSQRPDCNIGVCTTGLVVVDIDTKKGREGVEWFALIGGHYDTFVVQTATGGYHCYFNGPDSMLAVGIVPGIDIRSHHGYVVAPGSVTSARYEDCVDGAYTIIKDAPIAQVPESIKQFLKPPIHKQREDSIELDKEASITHGALWLQTAEPAVEGSRNHTAYKIGAKLTRDFALSVETAYSLMLSHWNYRCSPPLDHTELFAAILHSAEYGKGDAGAALPEKYFSGVVPVPAPEAPAPLPVDKGVHMGNAVDPPNITPRPWKVEKLLMNGDVTVLGGMGAAGKSMFEIVLAAHWALGKNFGPYRLRVPDTPLRSIIYNAEDDTMEQSRRLMATCVSYQLDYFEVRRNIAFMDDRVMRLCIASNIGGIVKPDNEAIKFIVDTAQQEHADVLIFDPMLNLHRCDENSNGQMLDVMNIVKHIARVTNTAAMIAQHTGKGTATAEKGEADTFRGASAIVNSGRVGVLMSAISKEDASEFGIPPGDRLDYARMDNAKTNLFKKTGKAQAWLQWETVALPTGDYIGVPKLVDLSLRMAEHGRELLRLVREAIIEGGGSTISMLAASNYVTKNSPIFAKAKSSGTATAAITKMLEEPARVDQDILSYEMVNDKRVIKISK